MSDERDYAATHQYYGSLSYDSHMGSIIIKLLELYEGVHQDYRGHIEMHF